MEGLLARGFQFWPLRKLLEYREHNRTIDPNVVVLTFDDGYQSLYRYAFSILRELQIPATLFLPTAFLDGGGPFPFDDWGTRYQTRAPAIAYRPVTTWQCEEMAASGLVELAAHTHTHRDFCDRPGEFRRDLEICLEVLKQKFGLTKPTFAFPFGCPYQGYADRTLRQATRQADVLCGLTTEAKRVDVASDPVGWGRFPVFSWDTSVTLAAKLHGWYGWGPRLRRRVVKTLRGLRLRTPRGQSETVENAGGINWLAGNRIMREKAS
jgi:peptidoglycan/xylan/chitin deacetylase (PgdA/CDA1 family)